MLYIYYVILGAVFFATLAMLIDKGLWTNTLTAANILLSGLIAYGAFEPVAKWAVSVGAKQYTYLLDFLCLWVLYIVSFVVLHRLISGALSQTRMRFKHPIDTIGGPAMAAIAGWLMTGIVSASLHAAPFPKDSFGGVFADTSRAASLTNPDLAWLSIAEKMLSNRHLGAGGREFSAKKYVSDFNRQREALDKEESLRVSR